MINERDGHESKQIEDWTALASRHWNPAFGDGLL